MVTPRKNNPRSCEVCGKDIPASRRSNAATCGAECARKRKLAYYKARSQTEAFKIEQRERMGRRRENALPNAERVTGAIACFECGNPLPIEAPPNRKTCSEECLREHRRKYIQRWHKTMRSNPDRLDGFNARKRRVAAGTRDRRRLSEVKRVIDERNS